MEASVLPQNFIPEPPVYEVSLQLIDLPLFFTTSHLSLGAFFPTRRIAEDKANQTDQIHKEKSTENAPKQKNSFKRCIKLTYFK